MKEKVYAIKPSEKEFSAMAYTNTDTNVDSCSITKVCTHLSLGVCRCSTTTNETKATKKRKLVEQATNSSARKKAVHNNEVEIIRWGYSTELMLYDDPWKIKKVLEESDLGNLSRLLLGTKLAKDLVVSVLGANEEECKRGIQVRVFDVDTNSMHSLLFKKWPSSKAYVFMEKWIKDFVARRALKRGDEVGFHWDPYNNRFNFTVLQANQHRHH